MINVVEEQAFVFVGLLLIRTLFLKYLVVKCT